MKKYLSLFLYCCFFSLPCFGQPDREAMELLYRFESANPQKSQYFEHIDVKNYIDNIRRRLYEPEKFCQGFGTHFCGPSCLIANIMLVNNQIGYVKLMIDLFEQGKAFYVQGNDSVLVMPDPQTRSFAGRIFAGERKTEIEQRENKGQEYVECAELLSNNHADQVLLLSLKHHYPGPMSKGVYREREASRKLHFASTLFRQFKLMAKHFFNLHVTVKGSVLHDMLPSRKKTLEDITTACKEGKTVFLLIDGGYFRKKRDLLLWGSHYICISDLQNHGKTLDFEIWEYGCRRQIKTYSLARFLHSITGYLIVENS